MEDSIPPYEKRVEQLRHGAPRKLSGGYEKIEHTGILELDDDTFYNEQDYDTRENSPPKKATPPPRRTSSLQGSPSPTHIHGHAHEPAPATPSPRPTRTSSLRVSPQLVSPNANLSSPLQGKARSPTTAGAKNVSFNENIVVLESVEEQEEAPDAGAKPRSTKSILQGGAGFGLLLAFMFLLLLNGLAFPALHFLFSAKLYTEIVLFWLWSFALRKPMFARIVCVLVVLGVTMAVLAGAVVVVYLTVCMGTLLALVWWVWMICVLLVPESQRIIAGGQ